MKFSLYFLCVVSHWLDAVDSKRWSSAHETSALISVSRFQGVENYYIQLKKKLGEDDHLISVSPREDVYTRKKMCKLIFRSNYFEFRQEEPVNVNNARIQNELKLGYPETFRSMYTEYRAIARLPVRRHYDNPYISRTVQVPGHADSPLKEYVFMCPVRQRRSNMIKEYYVSARYNVNGANHPNVTQITGRFIFSRDHKFDDSLAVYALAEEPASTVLTFDIDLMYFLRKGYNLPIERAEDDPICKLSDLEKLRLCTALFSSARYKGRVKFLPSMDSIETDCEKREIRFFIDVQRHHVNDTFFHEWMITCKAMTVRKGKAKWVDFYISRGYGPNRIFVYRSLKGKTVLYHHSANVGAVKE